jgi:hypothetical protein
MYLSIYLFFYPFIYLSIYLSICLSLSVCLSLRLSIYISMSVCLSIYSCCSHLEHRASMKRFVSLQFLNPRQSIGLLGRAIRPMQDCYLHRISQTQNKDRQSSMSWMEFEPTLLAFMRANTFHALRSVATAMGFHGSWLIRCTTPEFSLGKWRNN